MQPLCCAPLAAGANGGGRAGTAARLGVEGAGCCIVRHRVRLQWQAQLSSLWRPVPQFGVTAASDELEAVGSSFVQLKLALERDRRVLVRVRFDVLHLRR